MKRLCIQWPRFGPYHIARLRALDEYTRSEGVELIALETAANDQLYQWRGITEDLSFHREQVFPGRVFETIPPDEMHREVIRALDRLQPEAVLASSYSFPDARACLSWCRHNRRAAIFLTDTLESSAPRKAWREYIKSLIVKQFDAAFVSGTPHREYFSKLGFPEAFIFLGYSVVDNDYFEHMSRLARRAPERFARLPGLSPPGSFFLASSRFIPRKNLDGLIRAYQRYRKTVTKPWRLVILGDGPLRNEIETVIAELDVEGITLAGFRQIEELPAYYGLAEAFIHPAANEPWGLVVNEAMAAGLPVIVSKETGCSRDLVVEGVTGFTFEYNNEEELSDAMIMISSNPQLRDSMGRAAQEHIAGWSLDRFAEQAWLASVAALKRCNRRLQPLPAVALWALRKSSRSVSSFHTVEA